MDVSVLSQKAFKNQVGRLEYAINETPYGEEVVIWHKDRVCAVGLASKYDVPEVLEDLMINFFKLPDWQDRLDVRTQDPYIKDRFLLVGTDFQQRVWSEMMKIPKGEARSYQQIATGIGSPKAVRAVGTAIGRNPLAILIPCHRVIGADGGIGGYRWGLDIKKKLMAEERIL